MGLKPFLLKAYRSKGIPISRSYGACTCIPRASTPMARLACAVLAAGMLLLTSAAVSDDGCHDGYRSWENHLQISKQVFTGEPYLTKSTSLVHAWMTCCVDGDGSCTGFTWLPNSSYPNSVVEVRFYQV